MKATRSIVVTVVATAVSVFGIAAFAESIATSVKKRSLAADPALVKRGEYIVHQVGMCVDCHSPRGEGGDFIKDKHLTGSPIPFAPSVPMPAWATAAPPIAGMPASWSEEATVHFLMTGVRPNNLPPTRPPMPPYRLSKADADAVVAYLQSLGGSAR